MGNKIRHICNCLHRLLKRPVAHFIYEKRQKNRRGEAEDDRQPAEQECILDNTREIRIRDEIDKPFVPGICPG